ncbi:response regulator [Flavobacterium sp. ZT3R18]|uniref:response regulator n=1 Tax=Flavobacterium sp. ZT3R18 TaxID=2594429 RepID=UPI00117BB99A|nr:response regulator [Flavobacterium sp. ZT3R18]TRX36824.1 response regulator [Flavobacterium sp. ZT3R18]
MRLKLTTYSKLVLLIIGICSLFIFLFLSLYLYTIKQEDQVFKSNTDQYQTEINRLFDFNSKTQIVTINDLSYWDALVSFTKSRDTIWFNNHIVNEFPTYEVDYIGVYDLKKKFIVNTATPNFKFKDFIPVQAMMHLNKTKFSRFYMRVPEGIVEVFGGTIHPSNDPKKNKTRPSGYLFMARVLDPKYLKNLEDICSSKIKLLSNFDANTIGNKKVTSIIRLRDTDNLAVGRLLFQRSSYLNFEKTRELLLIIVIVTLFSLIAAIHYSRKWVYKPLRLVTNILESDREISISLLKKEPGEFGYIGNLFDDHRKNRFQLEKSKVKAEESDKLKSTFLANLSHEIRTPMNAIVGFSDLLLDDNLSVEFRKKYLKIIKSSGKNLVSIIEDLIEMSKIDAKQITPNYKGLNIENFVNELYSTLKVIVPEDKKVDFYLMKSDEKLPNDILTDEVKLRQVMVNLLTNSIKFTDRGHVSFGYTLNHETKAIEFRVEDTGLGISKKDLKVIFDRFRRVEDDYSISLSGLGLGLSISKAYVEMLGGKITVESFYGEGSVFKFSIPLVYDTNNIGKDLKMDGILPLDFGLKTILIAEDDNINYLLLKRILELKSHTVLRARNGLEVVNISAENDTIDLIFMDIKMPILDGYEAFKKIKQFKPELPIVAQTAHSSTEDKERILKAGFSGYITKPLDKEKIYELINQVFQNDSIC